MVGRRDNGENRLVVLYRASIALLYAHFEGYVKKASIAYLEYVRLQRLHYDELSDHFFTIALKQKFLVSYGSKAYSDFLGVTQFLRGNLSSCSDFNHKNVIDTESNLSSAVFKEIILCLGFDYAIFEGMEKLIDAKLLQKRNRIAHGEFVEVDREDYLLLHDRVIALLENFKTQIENSAVRFHYKRNKSF